MKLGAYDYITKPFSPLEELRLFLRRMAEKVRLVEENEFLRQRINSETAVHGIIGSSAKIQEVLRMVARLKDTRTPVLYLWGKRDGQGTGRARDAFPRRFWRPSFRRRRLRLAGAYLDRERALRLRKRRFYGCAEIEAGIVSGSRWRHYFPGRSGRVTAGGCRPSCCECCRKKKFVRWAVTRE